jgi:NADH-quinone oxidoreductase subunit N
MLPTIDAPALVMQSLKFLPELVVCIGIVLLLVLRLFKLFDRSHLGLTALALTVGALAVAVIQWISSFDLAALTDGGHWTAAALQWVRGIDIPGPTDHPDDVPLFGLLAFDRLTVFLRIFLLAFTALIIWLSLLTGIPDREDSADFYCLLLGATLGMMLMASANHLMMVFIAIEMASLPSYALAGFLKGRRLSSEAALKYVVYGGGAAGVMLYGISLLAGRFGTGYLPDLASGFALAVQAAQTTGRVDLVLVLGSLFLLIGVAFKLAAVPFHFWCPDVFEGASAEVAGFLSVASKAAELALLARLMLVMTGFDALNTTTKAGLSNPDLWMGVLRYVVPTLAVFAAVTATFGNLAAYRQTNLKRLLAYSTIAHAGYMMMGLCALTAPQVIAPGRMVVGAEAVLFYLIAYLLMNLGAFAVVAFLRNQTGSENLADFRGLVRRSPWMVVTLAVFLLSLLGIPPLIGFAAKFQIFNALYSAGSFYHERGETMLSWTLIGLLFVGGANTVLSAVYYIKVLKVMILDGRAEDLEGQEPQRLREPIGNVIFAGMLALAVFGSVLFWGPAADASRQGVARFVPAAARPSGPPGGVFPGGRPGGPPQPAAEE